MFSKSPQFKYSITSQVDPGDPATIKRRYFGQNFKRDFANSYVFAKHRHFAFRCRSRKSQIEPYIEPRRLTIAEQWNRLADVTGANRQGRAVRRRAAAAAALQPGSGAIRADPVDELRRDGYAGRRRRLFTSSGSRRLALLATQSPLEPGQTSVVLPFGIALRMAGRFAANLGQVAWFRKIKPESLAAGLRTFATFFVGEHFANACQLRQ